LGGVMKEFKVFGSYHENIQRQHPKIMIEEAMVFSSILWFKNFLTQIFFPNFSKIH
jgi:hypothetical protein